MDERLSYPVDRRCERSLLIGRGSLFAWAVTGGSANVVLFTGKRSASPPLTSEGNKKFTSEALIFFFFFVFLRIFAVSEKKNLENVVFFNLITELNTTEISILTSSV